MTLKAKTILLITFFLTGILMVPSGITISYADLNDRCYTELIWDGFSSGFEGWSFSSVLYDVASEPVITDLGTYNVTISETNDNPTPSAFIEGEGFNVFVGIEKTISLPDDSQSILLKFDAKLENPLPDQTHFSNLQVRFLDSDGNLLDKTFLIDSQTPVTESSTTWQEFTVERTIEYIGLEGDITILIGFTDIWLEDWDQKLWIDNIRIISFVPKSEVTSESKVETDPENRVIIDKELKEKFADEIKDKKSK